MTDDPIPPSRAEQIAAELEQWVDKLRWWKQTHFQPDWDDIDNIREMFEAVLALLRTPLASGWREQIEKLPRDYIDVREVDDELRTYTRKVAVVSLDAVLARLAAQPAEMPAEDWNAHLDSVKP